MNEKIKLAKSKIFRICRLGFGVGALYGLSCLARSYSLPTCEKIIFYFEQWGPLFYGLFVIFYVFGTIAFVPGTLMTLFGGFAFGVQWGVFLVLIGALLGAAISFLISRYLARDFFVEFMKDRGWYNRFEDGVRKNGLKFVFISRLVPIIPFNVLNYASGILPIKFRHFVYGSLLGMIPGTIVYVYLGEAACQLVEPLGQGNLHFFDLSPKARNSLFLSILLLSFLSLLPVILRMGHRHISTEKNN